MPSPTSIEYPIPQDWQELERLCRALFSELYGRSFQRHGRLGQKQEGVDIFGYTADQELFAVQCKGRAGLLNKSITHTDLDTVVQDADCFPKTISQFFLFTTAPDDNVVQQHAIAISQERKTLGKFPVHIWGWQTISEHIGSCPGVQRAFYGSWWQGPTVGYYVPIALTITIAVIGLSLTVVAVDCTHVRSAASEGRVRQSVVELREISEEVSVLQESYSSCRSSFEKQPLLFTSQIEGDCLEPLHRDLRSIDQLRDRFASTMDSETFRPCQVSH